MKHPKYSVIIPVYNRPDELNELLQSLTKQTYKDFDVVIVEDGSTLRSDHLLDNYSGQLTLHYFFKPNTGPGPSRNAGFAHAKGKYFVVFDSDCIIPPDYFKHVDEAIAKYHWDAWGGPDRAHEDFTLLQRAMGYTMSSFLTTGGIRGGKKHVGWFQPRSFNMGLSREVFERTGGFKFDRFAEDIELSIRMRKASFNVGLVPEAYVYHKRRTNFRQFYHQVFNFGRGRVLVGRNHPEAIKFTHWFPTIFTIGLVSLLITPLVSVNLFLLGLALLTLYVLSIFFHSWWVNKNFLVALLSVPAAFLQLCGYGAGFLHEWKKK